LLIAEILSSAEMIASIGGDKFMNLLFPAMVALASVEETVVRDATTNGLRYLFVSCMVGFYLL
jgi:hypothetical protein